MGRPGSRNDNRERRAIECAPGSHAGKQHSTAELSTTPVDCGDFPQSSADEAAKPRVKFALLSHTLPPVSNGQAIVLGRLLREMDSDDCVLIAQPLVGSVVDASNTPLDPNRLRMEYYILPCDLQLRVPRMRGLSHLAVVLNRLLVILSRARHTVRIVRAERCGAIVSCTGEWFEPIIVMLVARWLKLPMVAYIFDWYAARYNYLPGLPGAVIRWLAWRIEGWFLRSAATVIVSNETLRDEYVNRYGVRAVLVRNPTDFAPAEAASTTQWPRTPGCLSIRYTGAVYGAHFDAFARLTQAARQVDPLNVQIELFTEALPAELAAHGISECVEVHPRVPLDKVCEVQQGADILFLPLAFSSPYPEIIRTSAIGKFADYLASGRPILVHAPPDSWIATFCREQDCAVVVDEADVTCLAAALQQLFSRPDLRERIVKNARRLQDEFSVPRARRAFLATLPERSPDFRLTPPRETRRSS